MKGSMTAAELVKALRSHKYLLVRTAWGSMVGISGKVGLWAYKKNNPGPNKPSSAFGFRPCCFHEYITHKLPIVNCEPSRSSIIGIHW